MKMRKSDHSCQCLFTMAGSLSNSPHASRLKELLTRWTSNARLIFLLTTGVRTYATECGKDGGRMSRIIIRCFLVLLLGLVIPFQLCAQGTGAAGGDSTTGTGTGANGGNANTGAGGAGAGAGATDGANAGAGIGAGTVALGTGLAAAALAALAAAGGGKGSSSGGAATTSHH